MEEKGAREMEKRDERILNSSRWMPDKERSLKVRSKGGREGANSSCLVPYRTCDLPNEDVRGAL